MGSRIFTPAEATRTLPLVRRIVQDILGIGRELRQLWERDELSEREEERAAEIAEQLEEHFRELDQIGCSFRSPDFSMGLVDFPSIIDGVTVLLCWRDDEPTLGFYHEPHTGYAGRKPIPAELLGGRAKEPAAVSEGGPGAGLGA